MNAIPRPISEEMKKSIYNMVKDYQLSNNGLTPSIGYIAEKLNVSKSLVFRYLNYLNDDSSYGLSYQDGVIETEFSGLMSPMSSGVPLVRLIACRNPEFVKEDIQAYIPLPEYLFGKGPFFILIADGDSMINVGVNDGDYVIIRKQEWAREGDIVVALIDGETPTLKRYYRDDKTSCVILRSENDDMNDIIYNQKHIKILGIGIKVLKNLWD